jgi:hypothetical protein
MNAQEKVCVTTASGWVGRTGSEVVQFNNMSKNTVKCVKCSYNTFIAVGGLLEDFETNRKGHKRRSNTLDDAVMANLQQFLDQDPGRSMRSMARELGKTKCRRISTTRVMPLEEVSS